MAISLYNFLTFHLHCALFTKHLRREFAKRNGLTGTNSSLIIRRKDTGGRAAPMEGQDSARQLRRSKGMALAHPLGFCAAVALLSWERQAACGIWESDPHDFPGPAGGGRGVEGKERKNVMIDLDRTQVSRAEEGQEEIPLMRLEECINYLLTTAQHNVNQYLARELTDYDITPSQYGVLQVLWNNEGSCTPKIIADRLGLETSTISGTLERMQKKGLIDRLINMEDRREILVVLQDKGRQLKGPMAQIVRRMNDLVLEGLAPEQVAVLKGQLREIALRKL